jgi:hypothetical protein
VFFLIPSSLKLAFQEEAEAKEIIIIAPKFVFFCVLKIQNENILREEEEKHHAALLLLLSCIEKGESHRRERERKWTKRSSILNGLLR